MSAGDSQKKSAVPVSGPKKRIFQVAGVLLSAKALRILILFCALYISTYFIFAEQEGLRDFVFDPKIHALLLSTILSVSAGGIINQFYDREKDRLIRPVRRRIQEFIRQRYYFYLYISLNAVSLIIAMLASWKIVVFVLFYQFSLWLYSHKLSRMFIINNIAYVLVTIYPFLGALLYFRQGGLYLYMMGAYLFGILFLMDVYKDLLTRKGDLLEGYRTYPVVLGYDSTIRLLRIFLVVQTVLTAGIAWHSYFVLRVYFGFSCLNGIILLLLMYGRPGRRVIFLSMMLLRILLFTGVLSILANGIFHVPYPKY